MERELARDLLVRLMAIHQALQGNMVREASKFGLSVNQAAVSQDLRQHPGSTLNEVCQRLGWPKSTVSRLVDELVQRGLVRREVPANNRRIVVLNLDHTAAGCVPEGLDGVFPGGIPDDSVSREISAALDRLLVHLTPPQN